ncbi:methyltransferase domain-containing protein [Nocardia sp. NPDC058176]|uniref:methyltransferase domain-containing protein n=1 Tax=Nocardia sp. NPDC058176 TaxID=3346368 RepID=UPI0036DE5D0B
MSESTVFDEGLAPLRQWQASPWGRLRYTTAFANLATRLPPGPLDILDIGGGNGLDAVELAAAGHRVTIVDFSEQSLAEARAIAEDRGLAERITTQCAGIDDVADEFGPSCFDVLLCHNVIQYLPDPAASIAAALAVLRPAGLVSVIAPNADADPLLSAVRNHDLDGALDMLDAPTRYTVAYDTETRACYPDRVRTELAGIGLEVVGRFGIRTVCDYIVDDEAKADPEFYRKLERLELALAGRVPYLFTARFFHFVAARSD